VALLLERGADPNRPWCQDYPLSVAVRGTCITEVVELLVAAGANPHQVDSIGRKAADYMNRSTPTRVRQLVT
jgi:hypothetical protein